MHALRGLADSRRRLDWDADADEDRGGSSSGSRGCAPSPRVPHIELVAVAPQGLVSTTLVPDRPRAEMALTAAGRCGGGLSSLSRRPLQYLVGRVAQLWSLLVNDSAHCNCGRHGLG